MSVRNHKRKHVSPKINVGNSLSTPPFSLLYFPRPSASFLGISPRSALSRAALAPNSHPTVLFCDQYPSPAP